MDQILKNIRDLAGVHGSFVFDSAGRLYAHSAHAVFDAGALEQASQIVVKALDTIQLHYESWETMSVRFSDGWLLLRSVGSGAGGAAEPAPMFLAVIADQTLNFSFANVAIRVATGKIKKALQGGGSSQEFGPPSSRTSGMSFNPGYSNASAPQISQIPVPPQPPGVSSSGLSWSGFASSTTVGSSAVSVADQEASAFLSVCARALAQSVGPMAKVFVKEDVRKATGGAPFSSAHAHMLLALLETHIDDPADRAAFRKKVGV